MTIQYRCEWVEDAVERIEISHKEIELLTELPSDPLEKARLRELDGRATHVARTPAEVPMDPKKVVSVPGVAFRDRGGQRKRR